MICDLDRREVIGKIIDFKYLKAYYVPDTKGKKKKKGQHSFHSPRAKIRGMWQNLPKVKAKLQKPWPILNVLDLTNQCLYEGEKSNAL